MTLVFSTPDAGQGGTVQVFVNHSTTPALDHTLSAPPVVSPVTFFVGSTYSPEGWTANFDNVVINLH